MYSVNSYYTITAKQPKFACCLSHALTGFAVDHSCAQISQHPPLKSCRLSSILQNSIDRQGLTIVAKVSLLLIFSLQILLCSGDGSAGSPLGWGNRDCMNAYTCCKKKACRILLKLECTIVSRCVLWYYACLVKPHTFEHMHIKELIVNSYSICIIKSLCFPGEHTRLLATSPSSLNVSTYRFNASNPNAVWATNPLSFCMDTVSQHVCRLMSENVLSVPLQI